jgi:hypothetical protein
MRNVVIHELVNGHDPSDRPHRDICLREQAPDAKLAGIRMGFLEVIDLDHPWEPDLAEWGLGSPFFVYESRPVLRLKARNPGIDRGPRDLQKAANGDLVPPLIVELDDLATSLVALRMAMIVPQRQLLLRRDRSLMPEFLHGGVMEAIPTGAEEDARQFPIMEIREERFEPRQLLPHCLRHPTGSPTRAHLNIGGEQSQHPLLAETACKGTHGVGMGVRFLGSLGSGTIVKQHQGANQLVPPLHVIPKA